MNNICCCLFTIFFIKQNQYASSTFHFIYYAFELLYLNAKATSLQRKSIENHSNNLTSSLHEVIFF
jgi:hypothetical protein